MDGIKASGSENLYGKDKLNRMLELAGVKKPVNESTNTIYTTGIQYKHAPNGKTYGIFREGQQYFIKEAKTTDNLCVESFNYIDGLRFKNENKYSSYSSALRRLNLMFNEFNYTEMLDEEVDMVRTDRLDEKKYIIKVPVTVSDEEVASPEGVEAEEEMDFDLGDFEEDEISLGGEEEEVSFEDEEGEDEFSAFEDEETEEEETFEDEGLGDEFEEEEISFEDDGEEEEVTLDVEDEDETEKEIQKLAGKLSQKIRDLDGDDPELEKYAINMVISASHPEKMDSEDKEDIVDKLTKEPEEEEVIDIETADVELEEDYDEMEEMVDSVDMDEEMDQMEEKKDAEVIYGEEEEEEAKHPKIKVTKEGEIEIYESVEKGETVDGIKHRKVSGDDKKSLKKYFYGTKWSTEHGAKFDPDSTIEFFMKGDKKVAHVDGKWYNDQDRSLADKKAAMEYLKESVIKVESDEEVDEEYEKIMFESMIKRTVKKVLSK